MLDLEDDRFGPLCAERCLDCCINRYCLRAFCTLNAHNEQAGFLCNENSWLNVFISSSLAPISLTKAQS